MWTPNLRGRADEFVVRAIEKLHQEIVRLEKSLQQQPHPQGGSLPAHSIKIALEAGGSAPLNVEGLLGRLAQPQTGGAPMLAVNPSLSDPISQDGALFVLEGSPNLLYRVNRSQDPATFDPIGGSGSVTSVAVSGGTTGLGVTGSPITGAGIITLTLTSQLSINGTQVLSTRKTGWGTPSSTLARTTFATYAGQTVSNPPTQAEVQAIDDHLKVVSQRLGALITDLIAHGLIGA